MVRNPLFLSENQIFIYVSEISFPAEGREFESRLPLDENGLLNIQETVFRFCYFFILTS